MAIKVSKQRARRERNRELTYGFDLEFSSGGSKLLTSYLCNDDYNIDLYGRL